MSDVLEYTNFDRLFGYSIRAAFFVLFPKCSICTYKPSHSDYLSITSLISVSKIEKSSTSESGACLAAFLSFVYWKELKRNWKNTDSDHSLQSDERYCNVHEMSLDRFTNREELPRLAVYMLLGISGCG